MNNLIKNILEKDFLLKTNSPIAPNTKTTQFIKEYSTAGITFNTDSVVFCVENATKFLKNTDFKKYEVVFLGTNPAVTDLIKLAAYRCSQNCMTAKWVPGLLTNWKHKQKDFEYYRQLKKKFLTMSLEGLQAVQGTTRSKRAIIKEYGKVHTVWKGMLHTTERPKLLIVLDAAAHEGAIREAHRSGVPTIALCNSVTNPELVTYPIPCDTKSVQANLFYLEMFSEILYQKNFKK